MTARRSLEDEALDPSTSPERLWVLAFGGAADEARFEVALQSMWPAPVETIGAVRAKLGLGLMEARKIVEGAPARLEAGATVDVATAWVRALADWCKFTVRAAGGAGAQPLARLVARNTSAPPALLERLALGGEEELMQALVRNPSCPMPVLVWLGRARASLLLENPLLPLLLLEDPTLPGFRGVHGELLRSPSAFPMLLSTALLTETGRRYLASERLDLLSADQLESLSREPNSAAKSCLAANPRTPIPILVRLSEDRDEYVRQSVAGNASSPIEVLERLAGDPSRRVLQWLVRNGAAPPEARARAEARLR